MTALKLFLLIFTVSLGLPACSDKPFNFPESLRQQINAMELAFNNGETKAVLDGVAGDFHSEYFPERRQLKLFMLRQRQKHSRLTIRSGPAVINVQFSTEKLTDITATASFQSLLTGGGGWLPDSGQFYQFDTRWRWRDGAAEGEEWELVYAQWSEVFQP